MAFEHTGKAIWGTLTQLLPLFYAGKTSTERLGLSTAPVPVCFSDLPNIELLGLFLSSSFELRD